MSSQFLLLNLLCLINFQNMKNSDISTLSFSISNLDPLGCSPSPDLLAKHYHTTLHNSLNVIVPLKTRSVLFSRSSPWFKPQVRSIKAHGCQLECLFSKTSLSVHLELVFGTDWVLIFFGAKVVLWFRFLIGTNFGTLVIKKMSRSSQINTLAFPSLLILTHG